MDGRTVGEADIMSPPRQNANPGRPTSQSTPVRTPNPNRTPSRPGTTLKNLTNGDKATLVLKVRMMFEYYQGSHQGTQTLAIRLNNPNLENYKSKLSSAIQNLVFRVIKVSCESE